MVSDPSNHELSQVIGKIYDCALDPSLWAQALSDIRQFLNAQTCALALLDTQRMEMKFQYRVGSEPEWIVRQVEHYPEINEFVDHHLDNGLSIDEPLVVSRLMSPAQMTASPYWSTHVRRQGLIDIAQINILRSPTRLAMLAIGRHERQGEYLDRDIDLIRLLIPHVRRAVTISNVLDMQTIEKTRVTEALDALNLGVILADEDGHVLHANASARGMAEPNGPLKVTPAGDLRIDSKANAEIRSALKQSARNEAGLGKAGLSVRLSGGEQMPVIAHVLPLSGSDMRSRLKNSATAAIFIGSAVDEVQCANTVRTTFDLTAAESKVLGHILAGRTLTETASELGVAPTTARTHLNSIFGKTGVSRQSDLIRMAMQLSPIR
jgi:DNA-binding CsgD family transcriptional regulator